MSLDELKVLYEGLKPLFVLDLAGQVFKFIRVSFLNATLSKLLRFFKSILAVVRRSIEKEFGELLTLQSLFKHSADLATVMLKLVSRLIHWVNQ